jgi:prevent-host-death family protein
MREMSVRELRDSLSSIGEIVERDGEVVLTRHGRPLVKLVPLSPCRSAPSHALLRAGMSYLPVPSEDLVRADRERLGKRPAESSAPRP